MWVWHMIHENSSGRVVTFDHLKIFVYVFSFISHFHAFCHYHSDFKFELVENISTGPSFWVLIRSSSYWVPLLSISWYKHFVSFYTSQHCRTLRFWILLRYTLKVTEIAFECKNHASFDSQHNMHFFWLWRWSKYKEPKNLKQRK